MTPTQLAEAAPRRGPWTAAGRHQVRWVPGYFKRVYIGPLNRVCVARSTSGAVELTVGLALTEPSYSRMMDGKIRLGFRPMRLPASTPKPASSTCFDDLQSIPLGGQSHAIHVTRHEPGYLPSRHKTNLGERVEGTLMVGRWRRAFALWHANDLWLTGCEALPRGSHCSERRDANVDRHAVS